MKRKWLVYDAEEIPRSNLPDMYTAESPESAAEQWAKENHAYHEWPLELQCLVRGPDQSVYRFVVKCETVTHYEARPKPISPR